MALTDPRKEGATSISSRWFRMVCTLWPPDSTSSIFHGRSVRQPDEGQLDLRAALPAVQHHAAGVDAGWPGRGKPHRTFEGFAASRFRRTKPTAGRTASRRACRRRRSRWPSVDFRCAMRKPDVGLVPAYHGDGWIGRRLEGLQDPRGGFAFFGRFAPDTPPQPAHALPAAVSDPQPQGAEGYAGLGRTGRLLAHRLEFKTVPLDFVQAAGPQDPHRSMGHFEGAPRLRVAAARLKILVVRRGPIAATGLEDPFPERQRQRRLVRTHRL